MIFGLSLPVNIVDRFGQLAREWLLSFKTLDGFFKSGKVQGVERAGIDGSNIIDGTVTSITSVVDASCTITDRNVWTATDASTTITFPTGRGANVIVGATSIISGAKVGVAIYRDSVGLASSLSPTVSWPASLTWYDSPGAGTFLYRVYVMQDDGAGPYDALNTKIVIMDVVK